MKSDGSRVQARGKWSAQAEPFAIVPTSPGTFGRVFDQEKIAQGLALDVSPSNEGTGVAVAIKHNGDLDAYAFDPDVYAHGNVRNAAFALPHEEYEVTVTATAGEITAKRRFLLSNAGTQYRDLHLEPL